MQVVKEHTDVGLAGALGLEELLAQVRLRIGTLLRVLRNDGFPALTNGFLGMDALSGLNYVSSKFPINPP